VENDDALLKLGELPVGIDNIHPVGPQLQTLGNLLDYRRSQAAGRAERTEVGNRPPGLILADIRKAMANPVGHRMLGADIVETAQVGTVPPDIQQVLTVELQLLPEGNIVGLFDLGVIAPLPLEVVHHPVHVHFHKRVEPHHEQPPVSPEGIADAGKLILVYLLVRLAH
jgi:hypothetical protein